jgi:phosphate transport system substrate-binding protein
MRHSLLFISLIGCGQAPSILGPNLVTISGTPVATAELIPALVARHQEDVGSLRFNVMTQSNHEAMDRLLDRNITIAAVDRPHFPAEQEQAIEDGHTLVSTDARHILAVDAVAIAVHAKTALHSLTYDQTIAIFCTGEIKDWSQLGFEPKLLELVLPQPHDGSRAVFEDFFCGPSGMVSTAETASSLEISGRLANRPGTISIVSFAERSGKLLALRPDGDSKPLMPTQSNVIRGSYPLAYDLLLYTQTPMKKSARQFIDWTRSKVGQTVIQEQRFVPLYLRPDRLDGPRPLRETIHFTTNTAKPTQRSMARIEMLTQDLEARAGEYSHIVLEGFTDTQEGDNFVLAKERAKVVKEILSAKLPELEFELIPRGMLNPIAPNETPYGRQRNRRVQVYLEKNVD